MLARNTFLAALFAFCVAAAPGCSIRGLAVNALADSLAGTGDVFASDEDPDLVRDALPFALKTMETLLAEVPEHRALLLSTCQGFTQYAYAFVESDALQLEDVDFREAERLRGRAVKLYLRARGYCLRSVELKYPGITERLRTQPEIAAADLSAKEIDLIFWTGASWGSAISAGSDDPELVADLPAVSALMRRVLEIDEPWNEGAAHEVLISLESLPEVMGGSQERAREHFARAMELSEGESVGALVSLAAGLAVTNQDREEFDRLLESALAIDPDADPSRRLQNLVLQDRARYLYEHGDDLILTLEEEKE